MSLVEQIREKLDIAKFVAPYTNGLKPSGKNFFTGRCPFHQSPSDPPITERDWSLWGDDGDLQREEIPEDEAMRLIGAPMLPGMEE